MSYRWLAKWSCGRSAKAKQRARQAACQPLEERRLLASTIYVDAGSPGPARDGTSWGNAYADLQLALGAAVSGDTIRVAGGTYRPTADTDQSISFQLKTDVGVYGGYAGYGAGNPDARDAVAHWTILSGDIGNVGDNSDNSRHVVVGSGTAATAILDGFTISGGNAYGPFSWPFDTVAGGGIFNSAGSPTISNCIFSANTAGLTGGGMYNSASSSPTLTNCTFSGNSAAGGGAIANEASSAPTLTNCTFSGNSATIGSGGAISNQNSSPSLTNCTFSGNSAANGGGGIDSANSSLTLTNCTFTGNSARYNGGGMCNSGSSPTLNNCMFSLNSAPHGGGMYNTYSSPTLVNCTFAGNLAIGNSGGGMYNDNSGPTLTNCAFNGNVADWGGGMSNISSSSPTLTNCTFAGNAASGPQSLAGGGGMYNNGASSPTLTSCVFTGNTGNVGAGVYNNNSSAPKLTNCALIGNSGAGGALGNFNVSLPTLVNCIIWGSDFILISNASSTPTLTNCIVWGSDSPINDYGGPSVVTYSDVQGGFTGVGNINADPLFVRSPWAGADGLFDMANYDLHLREGSGGLDIGSNAAIPTGVTTDLAGHARIQNGAVDMGVYEGSAVAPAPKTLYVDASAPGANNGASWTDAFTGLQPALRQAADGDTIRIADGIYKPTATTDRTISIALRNGVAVYGGYAGYGASNPDSRDTIVHPTIFSGDIGTPGETSDNSYHVVIANGLGSSTILDGVTITRGYANGSATNQFYGGGLLALGGSPLLTNCTFSGNSAAGTYDGHGGGVYSLYSSLRLNNCVFSGNSAGGTQGRGGGMYNYSSSSSGPALTNCTFSGNTASYEGSGIYSGVYSVLSLANSIIWGNTTGTNSQTPIITFSATTITYNAIQGGFPWGAGNIDGNPLFLRAPSPGADGNWGTADDDYGDLRLQTGSPCINTGSNAAVPAGLTTDLAGNQRIIDGVVDMGAYEGANAPDPTSNHAPTGVALSASSIAETQPAGTSVGTLSTTDADTGDTFTYTLVSGAGSADNASFTISGDTLKTNAVFDYAQKHSFVIRVRSTDQGGLWFEKNLTIAVTAIPRSTVTGTIFNDANADGIRGKGEGILAGQKVFLDANNNGKLDAGEVSQVTDSKGAYTFGQLLPGQYHLRALPGKGWRASKAGAGYDLMVGAGPILTGKDFGLTQMALISGSVFNDANGNKLRELSETGLAGWTVFVDKNNNGKLDKGELFATTGAAGGFSLNLAAGTYTLRVVTKAGYKSTTPVGGKLVAKPLAGQSVTNIFGFKK